MFAGLVIQHAMRMRYIVIGGLPLSTNFFPPFYLINGTIFEKKKKSLNTKCVFRFSLQLLSETFLILRRTERNMIKNALHVKYVLFLSAIKET